MVRDIRLGFTEGRYNNMESGGIGKRKINRIVCLSELLHWERLKTYEVGVVQKCTFIKRPYYSPPVQGDYTSCNKESG